MDPLSIVMALVGVLLLSGATYDALRTTVAPTGGAGPLTHYLSRAVWRTVLAVAPGPRSGILGTAGTLVLLVSVVTWVMLLWAGWALVFAADADGLGSSSDSSIEVWDVVYFTGFTLFTLGMGDVYPLTAVGQVLTPVATLHGLFLLTLSITYLIPVMSAAVERRSEAANIWAMGGNATTIVTSGWHRGSFDSLERDLQSLIPRLILTAERHPTYPALYYFHTGEARSDFRARIAALDDAVTLLLQAVAPSVRPSPGSLLTLRRAIDALFDGGRNLSAQGPPPPVPDLSPLVAAGIPLASREEIERVFAEHAGRRRGFDDAVGEVGWDWSAVVASPASGL